MATEVRLPILSLPGLAPDSVGNYLASLGLLRVLSAKWPSTRIAWRDEVLQVVGGPQRLDDLLDELIRVANAQATDHKEWTQYDKAWSDAQKRGTKAQSGEPLALWQAQAGEQNLRLFVAHAVPHGRVSFNPLLGSGGNAGRRDFAAGWKQAVDALATARTSAETKPKVRRKTAAAADSNAASAIDKRRSELQSLVQDEPVTWLVDKLGAGSWFSDATKLYNSGQTPSREGQISPWAMALACEGLTFLAGGASRRLGARSRAVGAFPFVTHAVAPETAGEAGRILAEIWTPLWERPMTLAEIGALFSRGRAELRGRGALTPASFAAAIRARGVDAGVSEFRRFTLGRTTSANTFEPRFEGRIALDDQNGSNAASRRVIERMTALIEQRGFPRDRKVGQRWRFEGLRGPIEAALLGVAAHPQRSEASIALLDAVINALDRIDRNRGFREGKVCWDPLPLDWLPSLFADERPHVEARLALSLVSAFPTEQPFATYRFGVEWSSVRYEHTERPPARWVWRPGELARLLAAVLSRRLLDREASRSNDAVRTPGRAPLPATLSHVRQWLASDIDESLLDKWLSRLALFDWRYVPREVQSFGESECGPAKVDGELALLGLVQPLVDDRQLVIRSLSPNDLFSGETGARTTAAARSLVTLIRSRNLVSVFRVASSRYAMAGARLASFDVPWSVRAPERLIAALLFTISDRDRAVLLERWLRPRRRQPGDEAHVRNKESAHSR